MGIRLDRAERTEAGGKDRIAGVEINCYGSSQYKTISTVTVFLPSVFASLACGGGRTEGPAFADCGGAGETGGARVVVFGGGRVGYLRALAPATRAPFDAVEPIVAYVIGCRRSVEMRAPDNAGDDLFL